MGYMTAIKPIRSDSDYEHEHYAVDLPDSVEALKFRMEPGPYAERPHSLDRKQIEGVGAAVSKTEVLSFHYPRSASRTRDSRRGAPAGQSRFVGRVSIVTVHS